MHFTKIFINKIAHLLMISNNKIKILNTFIYYKINNYCYLIYK